MFEKRNDLEVQVAGTFLKRQQIVNKVQATCLPLKVDFLHPFVKPHRHERLVIKQMKALVFQIVPITIDFLKFQVY